MTINYSKIWREIGEAFEMPYKDRTDWQKNITEFGLCSAFDDIAVNCDAFKEIGKLGYSMKVGAYWWKKDRGEPDFTTRTDRERATFAYFMSHIGNKGYRELVKYAEALRAS